MYRDKFYQTGNILKKSRKIFESDDKESLHPSVAFGPMHTKDYAYITLYKMQPDYFFITNNQYFTPNVSQNWETFYCYWINEGEPILEYFKTKNSIHKMTKKLISSFLWEYMKSRRNFFIIIFHRYKRHFKRIKKLY